jgi:hypothetical protein
MLEGHKLTPGQYGTHSSPPETRSQYVDVSLGVLCTPSFIYEWTISSILTNTVHYGFVMQSVSSMQIAGRYQRFYPSLVASYHGLSLMGMDMLSYDVPKKPKPVVAARLPPPLPLLSPPLCLAILRPLPSLVRPSHGRRVATVCRFVCA